MNLKKTTIKGTLLSIILPLVSFAQVNVATGNSPIERLLGRAIGWVNTAIPVLITIATIFFIVSVIQFIREKDSKEMPARRQQMVNGIIGLFVIVAIWGIIAIIGKTLEVNSGPLDGRSVPCPPGTVYSSLNNRCQ